MSRRIQTGVLTAAGLALGLAGAAQAQMKPGAQSGLGLTGADVPPILQRIRSDPYSMPAEPICASATEELAQLDAVMGPEVDKLKTDRSVSDRAAGYVRGMIPYRGVVRFLTRADSKDRELQAAASAGYARRGFLHGLKAEHHCDGATEKKVAEAEAPPAAAAQPPIQVAAAEAQAVDTSARVRDAQPPLKALAAAPTPAPRPHVVYQLVDVTSGRAIIPDGPPAQPDAGPDLPSDSGR